MPAIPSEIDVDPELLGKLPNGQMGTITVDSAETTRKYGVLGVRFNTLRSFYKCVRAQVNDHKSPESCFERD